MSGDATAHADYLGTRRFASLDGLRCLAILPVIWHHSMPRPLPGLLGQGPLGVHLFFAISGFLITTLLLRERRTPEGISLRGFYARRSLRIFPLYYAVLGLYTVRALWFLPSSLMRAQFFENLPWFATFTTNWFVNFSVPHPVIFAFAWSLATEEQFYFVWAPVLRVARGLALPVLFVLGLLALDEAAERGFLTAVFGPTLHAVFGASAGPFVRVVTSISTPMGLGALLGCGLDAPRSFRLLARVLGARASAPIALAVLVYAIGVGASLYVVHLAMAALVGAVCIRRDHGLRSLLDARPLRAVGVVSYGMYLFHVAIIAGVKILFPAIAVSAIAVFSIALPLTLGVAMISYRYFERPFLSLRSAIGGAGQTESNEIAVRV